MKDRFFRFCRFFVRCHLKPYTVVSCGCTESVTRMEPLQAVAGSCDMQLAAGRPATPDAPEPTVFIVHHQNLRGPITTMAWFDRALRPWVLSAFCARETCFRQFCDYTFTQRYHYRRASAAVLAYPISFLVPALMNSMRALPVYREPRETIKTFRQSLAALQAGQSLLISPDVNYADSSETIGELYEGFLSLEKYYQRETGLHIPFVPLHIDVPGRRILVGQSFRFRDDIPFKEAKSEASRKIRTEMQRLEQSCEN